MNIFDLDIEQLDPEEAKKALAGNGFNRLPGVPPFLSKKECSVILGVSMKVINQLIISKELITTDIPSDSPLSFDLFCQPVEPQREICILRVDLLNYIEKSLLCNKPVLDTEKDR